MILYGELATRPEHEERSWLRQGGWRRLAERIESGEVKPDFGPARAHPTAGVVLAAARPPLVAFNIELEDADLEHGEGDRRRDPRVGRRAARGARHRPVAGEPRARAGVDQRARPPGHAAEGDRGGGGRPRGHRGGRAGGPGAVRRLPALPGRRATSAASRPSGTCSRTRYAQSHSPDQEQAPPQASRHPGGHHRAGGPDGQRPYPPGRQADSARSARRAPEPRAHVAGGR